MAKWFGLRCKQISTTQVMSYLTKTTVKCKTMAAGRLKCPKTLAKHSRIANETSLQMKTAKSFETHQSRAILEPSSYMRHIHRLCTPASTEVNSCFTDRTNCARANQICQDSIYLYLKPFAVQKKTSPFFTEKLMMMDVLTKSLSRNNKFEPQQDFDPGVQ